MDLNIFEKLKEIYNGIRKLAWAMVPGTALFLGLKWLLFNWLPARAVQLMEWVKAQIPTIKLDLNAVGVAWDRINQWVALNELLILAATFVALCTVMVVVKWIRRLLPF